MEQVQIAGWLLGRVRRDGAWRRARDARCAERRRRHVKTHFKNQSASEGGQLLSSAFFNLTHPALFVSLESLEVFFFSMNLCFHSFGCYCIILSVSTASSGPVDFLLFAVFLMRSFMHKYFKHWEVLYSRGVFHDVIHLFSCFNHGNVFCSFKFRL